ncbi:MAG: hypothetical protein FWE57_09570, partial [Chitinispirillia bacterium]|nr:hypothetical protein [Chitinispirillia bacterium]
MKIKHKLSIIWVAALLPQLIYSQPDAPFWINEAWRDMNYPSSHWYMGFSEDRLGRNENTAESLKRLERSAQNKMAESITVQISGKTALEVVGRQRQQGQQISETTDQRYRQSIQASASAEISNAEVRSYHDAQTGRIYAIAAVKKTDLANHYALRAEFHIQLAENAISEAKQLIQLGRKSDALRKLADGRHNL